MGDPEPVAAPDLVLDAKTEKGFVDWFRSLPEVLASALLLVLSVDTADADSFSFDRSQQ